MRAPLVTALAAATLVPAFMVLGSQPAFAGSDSPGGNNGTVKIAEIDDAGTPSSDPHVTCTFLVEWYGFDKGEDIASEVQFEAQSPSEGDVVVTGPTKVFVGGDAAGGGKDLDAQQAYTLVFKGETKGDSKDGSFHVTMTTETAGSKGSDKKSKVFWVDPCSTDDETTDPTPDPEPTPEPTPDPTPTPEPTDDGGVSTDPSVTTPTLSPWTWDWTYAAPTCDALTVDYPANIPSGQSNDVNVRFTTANGQFTLNFHNNTDTWSGHTVFTFARHPQWPTDVTEYDVVWVQVGGTNYHWQGQACSAPAPTAPAPADPAPADPAPAAPAPADAAPVAAPVPFLAAAEVSGFRIGTTSVKRGAAPKADWIAVAATDADVVQVQRLKKGTWTSSSTATIRSDGTAKVTYPRLTKRGTYKFRVVVDGVATKPLTVKVR